MAEVIKRLRKDKFTKKEAEYNTAFLSYELMIEEMLREKAAERNKLLKKQRKEREELMKEREERIKAEQDKTKAEQEKIKEREEKQLLQLKLLKVLMNQGVSFSAIAETLGISLEETAQLAQKVENLN